MRVLVLVTTLTLFSWPILGNAQTVDPLEPTFIAKSTFVFLADATNKNIQPKGSAYLPAGTRFLAFDTTKDYLGSKRRLILTEDGIWAYIIDSDNYYWNPSRIDFFRENKQIVIVRQKFSTSTKLSEAIALTITLTPSELYRFIRETEQGLVIAIDNNKLPQLQPSILLEVTVPTEYARRWQDTDKLSLKDIHPYQETMLNDVFSIHKDCDSNQINTVTAGGGIGIDLSKFFAHLKLDASAETKTIQDFGADVNVTRWYYKRFGQSGLYSVTKKVDCKGSQEWTYSFTNPSFQEVIFNAGIAAKYKLAQDGTTGQMLATCSEQYFSIEKVLLENSFPLDEIPFIISRTARFKDLNITSCATK